VAAGKPAELFVYPWQRHSFTGEGRDLFLQRIVAFYDLYLK
jgi:dipeptidyl aminopeptidase/acylaminoacyl peptidase